MAGGMVQEILDYVFIKKQTGKGCSFSMPELLMLEVRCRSGRDGE